jgi:hypothetical protein
MPIGTCDPATRGEAWNLMTMSVANGDVTVDVRYGWDGPRTANGVQLTNGSTTVTRTAGGIQESDAGRTITGTGIPAGATIAAVLSATQATLSVAATQTRTSTVTVGGSTRASAGGCKGPLVDGTDGWAIRWVNLGTVDYYLHTTGRRGQPRTVQFPAGQSGTYTKAQGSAVGYDDNHDFSALYLTADPNPPAAR